MLEAAWLLASFCVFRVGWTSDSGVVRGRTSPSPVGREARAVVGARRLRRRASREDSRSQLEAYVRGRARGWGASRAIGISGSSSSPVSWGEELIRAYPLCAGRRTQTRVTTTACDWQRLDNFVQWPGGRKQRHQLGCCSRLSVTVPRSPIEGAGRPRLLNPHARCHHGPSRRGTSPRRASEELRLTDCRGAHRRSDLGAELRICRFQGCPWSEMCLDLAGAARHVREGREAEAEAAVWVQCR